MSREHKAGFFSQLFFAWQGGLIHTGYKRPLQQNDIWTMRPDRSRGPQSVCDLSLAISTAGANLTELVVDISVLQPSPIPAPDMTQEQISALEQVSRGPQTLIICSSLTRDGDDVRQQGIQGGRCRHRDGQAREDSQIHAVPGLFNPEDDAAREDCEQLQLGSVIMCLTKAKLSPAPFQKHSES